MQYVLYIGIRSYSIISEPVIQVNSEPVIPVYLVDYIAYCLTMICIECVSFRVAMPLLLW